MPIFSSTRIASDRQLRYLRVHISEAPYWEFVTRTNSTEGVTIVAVTDDDEIVLVSQHRIPFGRPVIELPAGLVGDGHRDEAPEQAVARELREETGFVVARDDIRLLAKGPALAGLTDEVNGLYLAPAVRQVERGGGVSAEGEAITPLVIPLATALEDLQAREREGYLVDLKVYAGLHFLRAAQR